MDNGAFFIGDLIHSRHFSRFVRLCLYPGVEPVFIAPSKPWMSDTIEDFNVDFDVGELLGCEYFRATVDMKLEGLKGCYWETKGEEFRIYTYS